MAVDERLSNLRGTSRRQFLRWASTVGALMGLERARFLDALSGSAGVALADTAACASTMRSVHLVAGDGGLAWFQLIWPHTEIAMATQNNQNFAFHAKGQAQLAGALTDRPFAFAPQSPWRALGRSKQVTAIMAGSNETHTPSPVSQNQVATGVSMLAAVAAIQGANPTLLPVIAVNPFQFGQAPGAPSVASVGNVAGLVDLFNSAASRTLLQAPQNSALAESYYKAFLSLNRAAGNQMLEKGYRNGGVAANLIGRNLGDQLRPTTADRARYGTDGAVRTAVRDIADVLIIATKAFRLGLTSSIIAPVYRDDPHGAFGGGDAAPTPEVAALGRILDAFMADLASTPDPACGLKNLDSNVVLTVHGDTPKDPRDKNAWPDATPGNSNWMYVMGNGYLRTGWFGGVRANGTVLGFDPSNADPNSTIPNQASTVTTNAAAAAVAYAVARGDMRRVQDFYRGPSLAGLVVPQTM